MLPEMLHAETRTDSVKTKKKTKQKKHTVETMAFSS
jgi:hypothetical protein